MLVPMKIQNNKNCKDHCYMKHGHFPRWNGQRSTFGHRDGQVAWLGDNERQWMLFESPITTPFISECSPKQPLTSTTRAAPRARVTGSRGGGAPLQMRRSDNTGYGAPRSAAPLSMGRAMQHVHTTRCVSCVGVSIFKVLGTFQGNICPCCTIVKSCMRVREYIY